MAGLSVQPVNKTFLLLVHNGTENISKREREREKKDSVKNMIFAEVKPGFLSLFNSSSLFSMRAKRWSKNTQSKLNVVPRMLSISQMWFRAYQPKFGSAIAY